jgi:sec-independent protein translocase protein TatB
MFDFDIGKLMVVAIVALAVIPPKDLPRVMRTVGQAVGKMRRMAAEFQGQFMDAMREADLESVRKELDALNAKAKAEANLDDVRRQLEAIDTQAKADASFDPAAMIRDEATKASAAPHDIGTSEIALNAPEPIPDPPPEPAGIEAPAAKQSAAE